MENVEEQAGEHPAEEQEYQVEVSRTISTTVTVRATSPEAAMDTVNDASFPLPPIDEWSGHKDWAFRVYDAEGEEVLDSDR